MATCLIGLGSNLGNPQENLRDAVELLGETRGLQLQRESRLYRTAPMGAQAGEAFLNSVVAVETSLFPLELLDRLQEIEQELGRVRKQHWGPRSIDLDLLTYDREVFDHPRLQVPHPGLWYRRFVLDPLCDVAGEWWHPLLKETGHQLRARLQQRPLPVCVLGNTEAAEALRVTLQTRYGRSILPCTVHQEPALILSLPGQLPQPRSRTVPLPAHEPHPLAFACLAAALDEPHVVRFPASQ